MIVLLNASGMGHQWSFHIKDLSVIYGIATVKYDAIAKIKYYIIYVGGEFALDMSMFYYSKLLYVIWIEHEDCIWHH